MPMKVAVITGSTQGIGHALALALRQLGFGVVISAADGAEAACVAAAMGGVRNGVVGIGCDVTRADEVESLWEGACEFFGQVDVWVNNAGLALTGPALVEQGEADMRRMLDVNVMGTMLGARTAMAAMRRRGRGAIYNMLGAGADGQPVPRMIGYATTKAAVTYFTHALAAEAQGSGVIVGGLSPGLVLTEGFHREHARLTDAERPAREAVVNIIGDRPETIGRWAARILDTNTENDGIFNWLTPDKIRRRRAQTERRVL